MSCRGFLKTEGVLLSDQDFQQVIQVPLDVFAQYEAVVAGKLARVIATPEN